jgi:diadenosine tetraphosphate (Ap4A) HIT family hydrolase
MTNISNDCVFCKIATGDLPCFELYEDDKYLAFLDRYPESEAMTIIITKEHKPSYFVDVETQTLGDLLEIAKTLARKIDKKMPDILRTTVVFEGLDIPHLHMKLKPAYKGKFKPNEKLHVTLEDLEKVHKMLVAE